MIQSESEFPAKSKGQEGRFAVRRKRFSVEQIVAILKQAEVGVPVADLIRQAGISEQTFYRWKKQYVGLEVGPGPSAAASPRRKRAFESAGGRADPGQNDAVGCAGKKL